MQDKPVGARLGWILLGTKYLYRSPWFHLRQDRVRLPSGELITYTYQEHAGFVIIVPVTERGDIVLIRTYRYTVDDWVWELPAGGLGNRPGESLLEVAQSELQEEVGGISGHWSYHGWFYVANGTGNIKGHLFLARDVQLGHSAQRENTEVIEIHPRPIHEVLEMARNGEIRDGESALALLRLEPHLREMSTHARRSSG